MTIFLLVLASWPLSGLLVGLCILYDERKRQDITLKNLLLTILIATPLGWIVAVMVFWEELRIKSWDEIIVFKKRVP
jgi:hypothetical protein